MWTQGGKSSAAVAVGAAAVLYGLFLAGNAAGATEAPGKVTAHGSMCLRSRSVSRSSSYGRWIDVSYTLDGVDASTSWCDRAPPSVGGATTVCVTSLGSAWEGPCGQYPFQGGIAVFAGAVIIVSGFGLFGGSSWFPDRRV